MVEAASQGKSQMPVSLKFDLLQRPVAGQPLEVAIALLPQIAGGPATIDVTGSDGVQLASGDGQIAFPTVEPQQVYRHSITADPDGRGREFRQLERDLETRRNDRVARLFRAPHRCGRRHRRTAEALIAGPPPPQPWHRPRL